MAGRLAAQVESAHDENVSEASSDTKVLSLVRRGAPLASSETQLRTLAGARVTDRMGQDAKFERSLTSAGRSPLIPGKLENFQINLGRLCNMTCRHCHVDAGPDRTGEMMNRETVDACLAALDRTDCHTVDITGGAPELNPHFRDLVDECVRRGKHVIDRCNLTVLLLPKYRDLPEWLGERGVEIVCSLPHVRRSGTDAQRGTGTYERSIEALRMLNTAGYGGGDSRRVLTFVTNPIGAFLAPEQAATEREWKAEFANRYEVRFDRLIALNNMPISRFLEWLVESGNLESYLKRLVASFNPATIDGLMCRNTISVSWDGRVFDCDFNQMLDLESAPQGRFGHIRDFDAAAFASRRIVTARHCFGCTAGCGSSCKGATA
ncbi:MAG: arsenosugar biosynthesis radical SAM protein ArsS [Deltaproteobacteria bacterium]|nr:arsenosugar biosynthesis radical SAM protein ArsS [Deltaproteobacteria bacterium]